MWPQRVWYTTDDVCVSEENREDAVDDQQLEITESPSVKLTTLHTITCE